jgi:galactonate dehydratase
MVERKMLALAVAAGYAVFVHASAQVASEPGQSGGPGSVKFDQVIANEIGHLTRFPSLELGLDYGRMEGGCDPGYACNYSNNACTPDALAKLRETAIQQGVSCFKTGLPAYYEWIETRKKISTAVKSMQVLRESLGPDIDIAVDFHAKTSPSVASILVKEVEPLNLLFIEEPCPPENVQAMARIARRSTTPIATGERLVGIFGVREICERGVVDILQTDINHVGGTTGLWKVSQMAAASGISMAPHACESPIGVLATLQVNSAMQNFVVQEICGQIQPGATDKIWEEWLGSPAMRMVDGRFPLSQKPGLGFELSEASLAKYPVSRDAAHGTRVSRRWIGGGVVVSRHSATRRR